METTDAHTVLRVSGLSLVRAGAGDAPEYRLNVDDFQVAPGAKIGLIGESGSGKTSFLEVLGLLAWPDEVSCFDFRPEPGTPTIDLVPTIKARRASQLARLRAQCIGFVLQDGGLLPYLSIRQNAALSSNLSGAGLTPAQIEALSDAMGMLPYLDRYQSDLSGGQKQRAAVLRALSAGVPLLLADEPTAALDPVTSDAVMQAMVMSAESLGATQIVASHNAALMESFGFDIMRVKVTQGDTWRQAELVAA